jgi:hypothetical protein
MTWRPREAAFKFFWLFGALMAIHYLFAYFEWSSTSPLYSVVTNFLIATFVAVGSTASKDESL